MKVWQGWGTFHNYPDCDLVRQGEGDARGQHKKFYCTN